MGTLSIIQCRIFQLAMFDLIRDKKLIFASKSYVNIFLEQLNICIKKLLSCYNSSSAVLYLRTWNTAMKFAFPQLETSIDLHLVRWVFPASIDFEDFPFHSRFQSMNHLTIGWYWWITTIDINYLTITGWWFGTFSIFPYIYIYILGKINNPNWRTHMFQGVGQPPIRLLNHEQRIVFQKLTLW